MRAHRGSETQTGHPAIPYAVHSRGSLAYRAPGTNIYTDMVTENVDVQTYTVDEFGWSIGLHPPTRMRDGHGVPRPDTLFTLNFQPMSRALDRSTDQ